MSTQINVSCTGQALTFDVEPLVASGDVNEDVINFTFDSSWDGFVKTAVFYKTEDQAFQVLLVNDSGIIPKEVLAESGELFFGVFGVSGDVVKTSEMRSYTVVAGSLTTGTIPPDPTLNIYQQVLSYLQQAVQISQEVQSSFETFTSNVQGDRLAAEQAATNAELSRQAAVSSASAALDFKNAAADSAGAALVSQNAAGTSATNSGNSASAALASQNAAKASEDSAKTSENNAAATLAAAITSFGGFSFSMDANGCLIIHYTDPTTHEVYDPATMCRETTAQALADTTTAMAGYMRTIAET